MNSEKNQLQAIAGIAGFIIVCVVIFFLVGGNFLGFETQGVLGRFLWAVPFVLIGVQQLYVIPQYLKGYWELFSEEKPSSGDVYIPVVNENKIFPNEGFGKVITIIWIIIAGLVVFNVLPMVGIEFLMAAVGSMVGAANVASLSFYSLFIAIVGIIIVSFMRGLQYLSIRRDIYDLHNKYMGTRGTGLVSMFYRVMYFIPLARSFALLADMQIMDKLTKFNSVEDMKIELRED